MEKLKWALRGGVEEPRPPKISEEAIRGPCKTPIMENQMEKKMENEMETREYIRVIVGFYRR